MADRNKKRTSSFRKLFPSLFFSHKTKDKHSDKGSQQARLKESTDSSSANNHYQNPRAISRSDRYNQQDQYDVCIYENLTIRQSSQPSDTSTNEGPSNHSSSSTLVSDSVKTSPGYSANPGQSSGRIEHASYSYSARPQVPPRPQDTPQPQQNKQYHTQYPDVYYHSLEKITDKISPLNEIEIYKATKSEADPEPVGVGAEIKKISTTFLISPKKEAEVRTIQPTRARSLSFNKSKENEHLKAFTNSGRNELTVTKPYNYSAPTSPTPLKIPNMPKTVSPYQQVRKTMMEAEEKRNSLTRATNYNRSTPSPRIDVIRERPLSRGSTPISTLTRENPKKLNDKEKEKTRQKVEAFYWQKLRELKEKEDEYYLKQSLNHTNNESLIRNSNCSTPNSFVVEPRSFSLPRGQNLNRYMIETTYDSSPFVRGAPERRTDTFITNQSGYGGSDIVYRHPEKLNQRSVSTMSTLEAKQPTIALRGSLTRTPRNGNLQPKRVSFEEQTSSEVTTAGNYDTKDVLQSRPPNKNMALTARYEYSPRVTKVVNGSKASREPPRPPARTTSVARNYNNARNNKVNITGKGPYSESESGSEAGEIQRILQNSVRKDDWHGDGSRIDGGLSDGEASRGPTRGRSSRREDPRRHTLGGNHLYIHHNHSQSQLSSLDIEHQIPRYPPPTNNLLFDDDPGIMSEVETASTGFRRGGKQRSSLPVVRTPSKTLERPLGLVFLQYRSETKRALLPNEVTSIDTVKALFVRSFPKQLTMQYMDSPLVKIYIHDSANNMFYELEDVRSHLRDIRDRSVLRLFESTDMQTGTFPCAVGVGSLAIPPAVPPAAAPCSGPSSWDQDQSYFSEPEIDSEYHHQHVHKSKVKAPAYYMGTSAPSTLPRGGSGGSLLRAFSPAAPPVPADRVSTLPNSGHGGEGYMSSPERGGPRVPYEDPYYTQYLGPAAGRPTITPVIDEEISDGVMIDDSYQMYGVNAITTAPRPMPRPAYDARMTPQVDDMQRLRVEKMERQLANLTGLVQKALQAPGATAPVPVVAPRQEFPNYVATRPTNQDGARFHSAERAPKLGRDKFQKSVSFEKSVSFSDDPPDMNSPKQHSPQHSERDRLKPAPPPKPAGLVGQQLALAPQRTYTINVSPDFFNQLRVLHKESRDLRLETRNLRRSTLTHAVQMRQLMADTIVKIGDIAASFAEQDPDSQLTREEEIYRQDMLLLENDLYELEATVERLRGQAANRETRVNMADIERIAMVLSKSSKTVADWKLKFPILQDTMKVKLASEMEKVVRKEKMLEEEPERLELALRRCKKLTGTLVTLKRLACVQEQRLPLTDGRMSPGSSQSSFTAGPSSEEFNSEPTAPPHNKGTGNGGASDGGGSGRGANGRAAVELRPENALDALLDELQTFAKPAERGDPPLRRLHSYPSGSDTDASPPVRARGQHPPKPPVPERHPELLALAARRAPPPPPPRTTSRSPLASPPSPASPISPADSRTADAEPVHEADAPTDDKSGARQSLLELRHQELLKKQKALQEQYARLQMIQRTGPALPPSAQPELKKTGSESNLLTKMNLNLAAAVTSGSMTHLAGDGGGALTNKVYETDIL